MVILLRNIVLARTFIARVIIVAKGPVKRILGGQFAD